jgi:aminoglycoside phosphotransferase family enzyme
LISFDEMISNQCILNSFKFVLLFCLIGLVLYQAYQSAAYDELVLGRTVEPGAHTSRHDLAENYKNTKIATRPVTEMGRISKKVRESTAQPQKITKITTKLRKGASVNKMIEKFKENHAVILSNKTKDKRITFVGRVEAGKKR